MLRVQLYIQRHLENDLELTGLAKIAAFSPYHFHRIFRSMVGESLQNYIRRLRLEIAAAKLVHSDLAVTDVAREAGYDNLESFIRAFRERFGTAPGQYRKQQRGNPSPSFRQLVLQLKCKGDPRMNMSVKIDHLPTMRVAFVRHIGPYSNCCQAWEKLCNDPEVKKRLGPRTLILGISYDDPMVTDADKIRYDACVEVDDGFPSGRGISTQTIAGGRYAVVRHIGSYSGLAEVYRRIFAEWLPDSGCRLRDAAPLEIYRNCPETTPEAELITDICLPLQ